MVRHSPLRGSAKMPEKVCVTGGAGYVASWLIMRLLRRGYSVRATIRSDPSFNEEAEHLRSLPGADQGRLEVFEATLCEPDSFAPAVEGCVGVFHVAHPTDFSLEDPERTVVRAAVDGVLGIVRACAVSTTVRRLVYTSSASAVVFARREGVMDESMWTDVDYCREQDVPISSYFVSKTLAERAAPDAGEKSGVEVVTVLPSSVVGPFLGPHLPPSFATSLALVLGDKEHVKLLKQMQFVHIDDVASAHIFLFECEKAKGRYICSSHDTNIHILANCMRKCFPELSISASLLDEVEEKEIDHLSSKKLLDLGFEFKYSLEDMFEGAIKCCREKGFLSHQDN